jgi:thiazolylpeptide-type bacteriocin precursor
MGLDLADLPMDIEELDVDGMEVESLTAGLNLGEATPVSSGCSCTVGCCSCC